MATHKLGPYPFSLPEIMSDVRVFDRPPLHRALATAGIGVAFGFIVVVGRGTQDERDRLVAQMIETLRPSRHDVDSDSCYGNSFIRHDVDHDLDGSVVATVHFVGFAFGDLLFGWVTYPVGDARGESLRLLALQTLSGAIILHGPPTDPPPHEPESTLRSRRSRSSLASLTARSPPTTISPPPKPSKPKSGGTSIGAQYTTYVSMDSAVTVVIDITALSTANGARAQLWDRLTPAAEHENQRWTITHVDNSGSNPYYSLRNALSGTCLDMAIDVPDSNGARVQQPTKQSLPGCRGRQQRRRHAPTGLGLHWRFQSALERAAVSAAAQRAPRRPRSNYAISSTSSPPCPLPCVNAA